MIREDIKAALPHCLIETDVPDGVKTVGKVRDTYVDGDRCVIITTDRQSAFDRVLAAVPFKGQILNLCSAFWFEMTKHIVDNHMLSVPHPNVMAVKKCDVLPVEFVVRGYITGSTSTSLWTQYEKGVREYCGVTFPDGLVKDQKLEKPVLTPTTKSDDHDEPISPEDIVSRGLMTQAEWDFVSEKALALFEFGSKFAEKQGLVLVDTKYEFGKDIDGNIILIDEVHTPDSSRYWVKAADGSLEHFDKEFLRLWFKDNCDPYNDEILPDAPEELIIELSYRYIKLFEKITGKEFASLDAVKGAQSS